MAENQWKKEEEKQKKFEDELEEERRVKRELDILNQEFEEEKKEKQEKMKDLETPKQVVHSPWVSKIYSPKKEDPTPARSQKPVN